MSFEEDFIFSFDPDFIFSFDPGMSGSSASSSSCTVTYVDGTASVSCVDSTSSGYQVILLQDNDPYNLTVVNVRPGEKQTVPVVPSGRYCIMELPMGDDIHSEVRYTREFAEFTQRSTSEVIYIFCKYCVYRMGIHVILVLCDLYVFCHHYSRCCGTVHIHDIPSFCICGSFL